MSFVDRFVKKERGEAFLFLKESLEKCLSVFACIGYLWETKRKAIKVKKIQAYVCLLNYFEYVIIFCLCRFFLSASLCLK